MKFLGSISSRSILLGNSVRVSHGKNTSGVKAFPYTHTREEIARANLEDNPDCAPRPKVVAVASLS